MEPKNTFEAYYEDNEHQARQSTNLHRELKEQCTEYEEPLYWPDEDYGVPQMSFDKISGFEYPLHNNEAINNWFEDTEEFNYQTEENLAPQDTLFKDGAAQDLTTLLNWWKGYLGFSCDIRVYDQPNDGGLEETKTQKITKSECALLEENALCPDKLPKYSPCCAQHGEPSMRPTLPLFDYVKVAQVKNIVETFVQEVQTMKTGPEVDWPTYVPFTQHFFGNIKLGVIDFGGIKSGTAYLNDEQYGVLVNYSGEDGTHKLKNLYPDSKFQKVWRILLVTNLLPKENSEDWTFQELRGQKSSVHYYNKMAMYIFGGEIYFQNDLGHLEIEQDQSGQGKGHISFGPSNRDPRKRKSELLDEDSEKITRPRKNYRTRKAIA